MIHHFSYFFPVSVCCLVLDYFLHCRGGYCSMRRFQTVFDRFILKYEKKASYQNFEWIFTLYAFERILENKILNFLSKLRFQNFFRWIKCFQNNLLVFDHWLYNDFCVVQIKSNPVIKTAKNHVFSQTKKISQNYYAKPFKKKKEKLT